MATKKVVAAAPKPSASRAVSLWEEKLAAAAAKSSKAEKVVSGIMGISTRGGIMTIDDKPVPGNELDVIVLVSVHVNEYHVGAFNDQTPQIPVCYSFGDVELEEPEGAMAPHPESEDKQGDDNGLCAGCWANVMGSADVGRGKACKNVRRLALISADVIGSAQEINDTEVRALKVPVMSVKGWAMYVKQTLAEDLKRPYWGVVTTIKIVPDAKSQFRITFTFKELIDFTDETFEAIERKIKLITPQMTTPYVKMAEAPPPPPPRGRPAAKAAPVKPVGRAAEAMARVAAKTAAPTGKRAKY